MGLGKKTKRKIICFPGCSLECSNEMIEEFFSQLVKKHDPLDISLLKDIKQEDMPSMDEFTVYNLLCKIKQSSTPAPGDVPTFIYREFALLLAKPVTTLINLSLTLRKCPERWKKSFLLPLPKTKTPQNPEQIRPIVISSPLSKLVERIVMNHMGKLVSPRLDRRQFGGIKGKNAIQYMAIYVHTVLEHLENEDSSVISVVTDFKKAFDNVNHNILMSRLLEISDHSICNEWIASFLKDRSLFLLNDKPRMNKALVCSNGLPQGSVMGCFLYAVYVDDLAKSSEHRLKFVDDLTLPCLINGDSVSNPQEQLNSIFNDSKDLLIPFNVEKCLYIEHNFRHKSYDEGLILDNHTLLKVDSVKILGIKIQKNLTWSDQVLHMVKMANSRIFLLYRLRQFGLSFKFMLYAYITFIRPVLEYAVPIWHQSITKNQINCLESIQKRVCRIILGSRHDSYEGDLIQLDIKTLYDRRIDLCGSFAKKFMDEFPEYVPRTQFQISGKQTRNSNKFIFKKSTMRFGRSPIMNMVRILNMDR